MKFLEQLDDEQPLEVYFRLYFPAWETTPSKDREERSANFMSRRVEESMAKFFAHAYARQRE